jgi:Flp pilus assembly protein TadG
MPDVANQERGEFDHNPSRPRRIMTITASQPERGARRPGFFQSRRRHRCSSGSRATAALEFAMATPLLIVMLGGAADYGLAQFYRTNLANAVEAGCEYAYLTSQAGGTVTSANIQTVVTNTMFLPTGGASALSVTVTGPKGYCVTGTGPTMSAATAGSTCSDGSTAGTYVVISATYTTNGLMNGFMAAATNAMTESATVRLN